MPTINLEILDRTWTNTPNSVHGSPSVMIFVTIDGIQVIPGQYALVDTGADYTIISSTHLAQFKSQVQPIDKSTLQDPVLQCAQTDVFLATVEIDGLHDPIAIHVIEKTIDRHPLLVGRNLLERYRLVYDPRKPEYTLTKL